MQTTNVKGVYRFGKVELLEPVEIPENTEVSVQVPVAQKPSGRMITFGMFPELKGIAEEDFKAAEWHGEREFEGEDDDELRR